MNLPRIVLIGHGYWGKIWEKVIKSNDLHLVGIVDAMYNNNISDFPDNSYDYAIVATPIDTHYNIASLLKNKRFFVSKF